MTPGEEQSNDDDQGLTAAAHAVASWARARQATWQEGPAGAPPPQPTPSEARSRAEPPARIERVATSAAEPLAGAITGRAAEPGLAKARRAEPSLMFGAIEEAPRGGVIKWIARAAVAAVAVGAVVYGVSYVKSRPIAIPKPAPAPETPRPVAGPSRAGTLHITSTPAGARVIVDGKTRGDTPIVIDGLLPGRHSVEIQSGEGTITRSVTITAGQTTEVDEAIYAGWVTVYAPFDVTVSEAGRALRADDQNQILLRPGSHELHVTNTSLAFDDVRNVDVKPGQVTMLYVTPPKSTITVTASEPAEVWVDGTQAGAAPLFSLPIDLGTHDVIVRRAGGGERRMSVTVTTKPQTVAVDFSKPGA